MAALVRHFGQATASCRRCVAIDSNNDLDDGAGSGAADDNASRSLAWRLLWARDARTHVSAQTNEPHRLDERGPMEAAPSTTIRRRKLVKLDNDASLLRPWQEGESRTQGNKGRLSKTLEISPPPPKPTAPRAAPRRTRHHIEQKTGRTQRVSGLPAGDADEALSGHAAVLKAEALEHGMGEGRRQKAQTRNRVENDIQASGTVNESCDDSDSSASEFQGGTPDSGLSEDSLDWIFSRSPRRQRTATRSTLRSVANPSESAFARPSPFAGPQRPPSPDTDEGSSAFFSADEFPLDRLTKPLANRSLHGPAAKLPAQSLVPVRSIPSCRRGQSGTPPPPERQPSHLMSPTKKLPCIPQTPHRQSTDAFWNQAVVDDWNMEHSPRKLLFNPDNAKGSNGSQWPGTKKGSPTAAPSSRKQAMTGAAKEREARKLFQRTKQDMAEAFLAELDFTITKGELGRLAAATGGVRIEWTNKLNTTAGRANWKRETLRPRKATPAVSAGGLSGTTATPAATAAPEHVLHHAYIELAEKVIDDEHRLLNVIAHEFCHLANFMVSGITSNPHGKEFKGWAAQCSHHFGHRGVQVTTKHAYAIDFKYVWTCEVCATEFKRHSKSIDPARHRCGACKGVLAQTKPQPRGAGRGGQRAIPGPSEYQRFMKEHMATVRRENPDSPQKVIMKLVADKWAKAKELKSVSRGLDMTPLVVAEAGEKTGDSCVDQVGKVLVDLTLD